MRRSEIAAYALRVGVWTGLSFATYGFWRWCVGYVLPFVLAVGLAVLLVPVARWLERQGASPGLAAMLSLVGGIAALVAALGGILAILIRELGHLARMLPAYVVGWERIVDGWMRRWVEVRSGLGLNPDALNGQLSGVMRVAEATVRHLLAWLLALPDGVLVLLVALIAVFFLVRDRGLIARWAEGCLPRPVDGRMRPFGREVAAGTLGFLRAQATLVGITTAATTAGLWLVGSRYALVLGLLAGLLDLIPFLGPTALLVPWAAVLAATGDTLGAAKLMAVLVAVALTRQLVEPRLIGQNTGLHPLVALLAFYAGVRLFGPAGFIIGPISAVVIRAGARFLLGPPLIPTSRTG